MKKIIRYTALAFSALFLMPSCTGNFEKMNTPPFGVTDEELGQDNNFIGMHFPTLEKSIYYNRNGWGWDFQTIQNLTSDIWSGYMATPSNFKGGINTQTYALTNDWTDEAWTYTYSAVMTNQLRVKEKCEQLGMDTYAHFNAINSILRVFAMSRVCDEYGPIIYTKYGESMTGGTYDSAQDAYKAFFAELTDASRVLDEALKKPAVASFAKFDMAYGGDLNKWLKLCNTLRLRLAMRVVKYDKEWAKKEAEAAIVAPQGVLKSGESFIVSGYGWVHPLYTCSIEYNDIFVSANVVSILGGYNDPRLAKIGIAKGTGDTKKVVGVRTGIPGLEDTTDKYKAVVSNVNVIISTPGTIMAAAEAYFLLAEAALRGWNAGSDAKTYYEQGVAASFSDFGVSLGDYLTNSKVPAAWVDPLVAEFNSAAVSTVSPKWEDAKTDEQRLEKIITQKWIAAFPEGKHTWAEWRRTGYPKLFPVLKNDSQGLITTEYGVRRLPFVLSEVSKNPEGYANAVKLLGGPDNGATRLFWDVNKGNFE